MPRRKKSTPIQFKLRVRDDLRDRIASAAKARGISVNAEAVNRLEQSFDWETKFGTAEKMLQEASASLRSDLDAHLRAQGFYPVATVNGTVWLSPGMDPLKVAVWTEPTAFQKAQEEAMRAIFREIVQQARPSVRREALETNPTKAALDAIEEALASVPRAEGKFDEAKFKAGTEKLFADLDRILRGTPQKVAAPPSMSKKRA